jgi:predicted nucleotidyltransferase
MADTAVAPFEGLPGNVAAVLSAFIGSARDALADDLVSAVLFGSAAEGKLGPASDVNLLLVLRVFAPDKIVAMRDALLTAEAAIKLRVMFVLEEELSSAADLFAQKFADILRRHRIVFGENVLALLKLSRSSEIFRLRQVLLNLSLRLREAYATRGQRPEQVARILTDTYGPLRAACATLLELEGQPMLDANAALKAVATSFGPQSADAVGHLRSTHDGNSLDARAQQVLFDVLTLAVEVYRRAARLS